MSGDSRPVNEKTLTLGQSISRVVAAPDGGFAVLGGRGDKIHLWNEDAKLNGSYLVNAGIDKIAVAPDYSWAVLNNRKNLTEFYQSDGVSSYELPVEQESVSFLAFSENGHLVTLPKQTGKPEFIDRTIDNTSVKAVDGVRILSDDDYISWRKKMKRAVK
ncbi:MAG: hypothetical protein R3E95_17905 [Thiolinea sp.]